MLFYLQMHVRQRPFLVARWTALVILVTTGAVWAWAHEGHEALPTRGAKTVKNKDGRITGVILSREARKSLDLKTARVEDRRISRRVLAYASLVTPWQKHAFATARLAGRIEKLHVRPGEVVRAGQVLAEVKCVELENLQLELLTGRSEGRLMAKLLSSSNDLAQRGAIPAQTLMEVRNKHQQNLNLMEIARSKWASLGLDRDALDRLLLAGKPIVPSLPVRSPIAGTVTHADLNVGKVIEPTEHLFEIVDLSTVWVKIGVLERDMRRVDEGQEIELTFPAYPGEGFRARVQVKGPFLDPHTHVNTVWAEMSNPASKEPRFYPGLDGQAELIQPASEKSIVVPAGAVIHDGVESYVLVEGADTAEGSEYLRVPIVVGIRTEEWVEVLGGDVFPGGFVVTQGGHELASFFVPGVLRPGPEARADMGLRVEDAAVRNVESVFYVDGTVEVPPDRRATMSAQLAGTLQWIGVDRGQKVEAGQVIARIASLELQTMQLKLLEAHLDLRLIEDTLGRMREARDSVPARLLLETETRRNTLRFQNETLSRKLLALGLSEGQVQSMLDDKKLVDWLPLRAIISGRVVRFDKVLGQALKAEEVLFEIQDSSDPLFRGYAAPSDLAHVRVGQKARVRLTADPAFVGEATVVRSGRVLSGESRVLSFWAKPDNQPSVPLMNNQLARLTLVRGQATSGVAVPLEAVVLHGTRPFVFVQQKDGSFDRRAVETGVADDRHVLITKGLSVGETVAVAGTAALQTAYASIR
jgi:membrane fusion protein, heavy metal efflux system